jgi:hypothetical protein
MRATLTFTLPDQYEQFEAALAGETLLFLLEKIQNECRRYEGEPLADEILHLIDEEAID